MTRSPEVVSTLAVKLKWSHADCIALLDDLEPRGIHVVYRPVSDDLCPCGYHFATESGLCLACEREEEERRRTDELAAEHARLETAMTRMRNCLKSATRHERRRFFANPRDAENRERWRIARELIADIEESLDRDGDWDDTGWEEVDE